MASAKKKVVAASSEKKARSKPGPYERSLVEKAKAKYKVPTVMSHVLGRGGDSRTSEVFRGVICMPRTWIRRWALVVDVDPDVAERKMLQERPVAPQGSAYRYEKEIAEALHRYPLDREPIPQSVTGRPSKAVAKG